MVEGPKTGDSGEPVISDGFRSVVAVSQWSLSTLSCSKCGGFSHGKATYIKFSALSWPTWCRAPERIDIQGKLFSVEM